jgi:tryptophanyl-tRNA synthetase
LDKINEHFAPYVERRQHLLDNPKEVKEILEFGASKARKIASVKMEAIRDIVGL